MAKATPALTTALRSLNTAKTALDKVLIAYGASGVVIKEGSETRTDVETVSEELERLFELSSDVAEGTQNLINCLYTTVGNAAQPAVTESASTSTFAVFEQAEDDTPAAIGL